MLFLLSDAATMGFSAQNLHFLKTRSGNLRVHCNSCQPDHLPSLHFLTCAKKSSTVCVCCWAGEPDFTQVATPQMIPMGLEELCLETLFPQMYQIRHSYSQNAYLRLCLVLICSLFASFSP